VLFDTGALLALTNSQDANHPRAVECLDAINQHHLPVFVSLPTVYETYQRLLFDLGQNAALRFFGEITDGTVSIIRTVNEDEVEARRLIGRYRDLNLTLTDAANMAIMTRLGIAVSFSFDRHFPQAGFIRIPPFHL
jgi:predicted nucleic acid-binding protein